MSKLSRFGVSLEKELLREFDIRIKEKKYTNRSEALRDLIRAELVKKEWQLNKEVSGAITLVYNHHQRQLVNRLLDIQHAYHKYILSTQHLHLDQDNCLEVIVLKGQASYLKQLYDRQQRHQTCKFCRSNYRQELGLIFFYLLVTQKLK